MKPLRQDKLLLPVLGKPLFYYVLQNATKTIRFDQILIIANSNNKNGLQEIADELKVKVEITVQPDALGMADALIAVRNQIKGEILVANADDLLEPEVYGNVLKMAQEPKPDIIFAGFKVKKYFPGGYLKMEQDKVTGVVEKPGEGREPSDLVKLVVDYFRDGQKLIEYLEQTKSDQDDVYEKTLTRMIEDGAEVGVVEYLGRWQALKYPWHVLGVMESLMVNLKPSVAKNVQIADSAQVIGSVILEAGVKIFDGAVVKGPAFVGKNTIVGNNALIRDSIIGENCVVGFGTEIARSYIGNDSWFHTNYVGDSVIEGDFGMGSGGVIANLRLDNKTVKVGTEQFDTHLEKLGVIAGRGVRIGVNASTMPGVRIESGSMVGPGVVLTRDLAGQSKILVKQEYKVSKNDTITGYDQFRKKLDK